MSNDTKLYSTEEAAKELGISSNQIRVILGRHPELAPRKIGRAWVWTDEDIERLSNRKGRKGETTE